MVKTGMKVAIKTEPANAEKKKLQHEKEVLSQLRGTPGIPKVSTRIIAEGPCARTRSLSTHPRNSEELSSARGAHVRRSSRQPCTRETTSTGAKRAVGKSRRRGQKPTFPARFGSFNVLSKKGKGGPCLTRIVILMSHTPHTGRATGHC